MNRREFHGFIAVAEPKDYCVNFRLYADEGAVEANDWEVDGHVKWDGCSNWTFGEVIYHACSQEALVSLGKALAECWLWTKELLPTWDGS